MSKILITASIDLVPEDLVNVPNIDKLNNFIYNYVKEYLQTDFGDINVINIVVPDEFYEDWKHTKDNL